jgi:hypothetical protein
MKATSIFEPVDPAYIYMERYVNEGSPSGFTQIHKTSAETSPFLGSERFALLEFDDTDVEQVRLGAPCDFFDQNVNYAHPDSVSSEILKGSGRIALTSGVIVSPTSGGRTMLVREPSSRGFLKLTYDTGRLGRVDRQLTLKHCQSSLEVSKAMKDCIHAGRLPPTFSILLEESAKISLLRQGEELFEWGTIYRERHPYPHSKERTQVIPGFALFSPDMHSPGDELLINQLIELSGVDPSIYLTDLLAKIVECYWSVVLSCAFHLECHAQNCLFEIAEDNCIKRVVIKDMDSVDKDLPLARKLGLNDKWESDPYMCFDPERVWYYSIRSSYIYDFKVGEYLLSKIIGAVEKKYDIDRPRIERDLQSYVRDSFTCKLPEDYWPNDGCWYDCDNSERKPGARREYFPHKNPKFR